LFITWGFFLLSSSKNFKGQLLFNIIISAGFLLGLVLFGKFTSRFLIFTVGELAVIMFILRKGTVLTPQKQTGNYSLFAKTSSLLIFSCLIDNLISQWDRIILAEMVDKIATAQFFAFSTAGSPCKC